MNPISGSKEKNSLRELIHARTWAAGIGFEIYPSNPTGDYSFLYPSIEENGVTDIIIAGGDGTINQVVKDLRKFDVNFGIIPCGSGNGLAFSAGLVKDRSRSLDIIFKGKSMPTDAFTINGKFACMLCGLGFDAQVAHDFAHDPKRGLVTYIKKTVSNFFTSKTYPFVINTGGRILHTDSFFISIANSNQFGNHFTIAPSASLTDGMLDIVVMNRQNKLSLLYGTMRQVFGYHQLEPVNSLKENKKLLYFQSSKLVIENLQNAPMHIDGDPVDSEPVLEIELIKNCFKLIYP